jgi:hypothetical protein
MLLFWYAMYRDTTCTMAIPEGNKLLMNQRQSQKIMTR